MSDFICTKYNCPNRTSFGYCGLTACNQVCPQTRWTDKLSLDSEGNIRDFEGNIVGHYDLSNFPDYTANNSRSIEFVVKEIPMERNKLSDRQLANLIMRINGEIEPIGETYTDDERLNNLIGLQSILELLLDEIFEVCRYHDRPEASMSDAGKQALIWIMDIQEQINDTIGSIKNLDISGDNNE